MKIHQINTTNVGKNDSFLDISFFGKTEDNFEIFLVYNIPFFQQRRELYRI